MGRGLLVLVLVLASVLSGAPAAGAQSAGEPIVILLSGLHSSGSAGAQYKGFEPLRRFLAVNGVPERRLFPYSYAGGTWQGSTWRAAAFTDDDTQQPLWISVARLRELIRGIRQRDPGATVRVVGFSLGGLVAFEEVAQAAQEGDRGSLPDRVLAVSSPLSGADVDAKCNAASRGAADVSMAGAAAALGAGMWLPLFVGIGGAMWVDGKCPRGPVGEDLYALYLDPGWREQRQALLARATSQFGVQLAAYGHDQDCTYYIDLCTPAGDSDDRWTNFLPAPVTNRSYVGVANPNGAEDVGASHSAILNATQVLVDAADFIMPPYSMPAPQRAAPPAALPTPTPILPRAAQAASPPPPAPQPAPVRPAATPTPQVTATPVLVLPPASPQRYAWNFNVGPLKSDARWVSVDLRRGQRLDVTAVITNAGRDIDVGVVGPGGVQVMPYRRFTGNVSFSITAPQDGPYFVWFDNSFSLLRTKDVSVVLTIVG